MKEQILHPWGAVRPYWNISGLYIVRGWVLYYLRRLRYKATAYALAGGLLAIVPVLGYQTGGMGKVPAHKPVSHTGSVTLEVLAAVPALPPPPVPPQVPVPPAVVVQSPATIQTSAYGRANGYAYGNCTYYVASRRSIPRDWGNARNWLYAAGHAGYSTSTTPVVGAIAWTSAGYYGHVALVEVVSGDQVKVSEMNYHGWNRINTRWAPASSFRYIY